MRKILVPLLAAFLLASCWSDTSDTTSVIPVGKPSMTWGIDKIEAPKPANVVDFVSDDSILKFVWRDVHFNNLEYKPNDLVAISWAHLRVKSGSFLRLGASKNLSALSEDFYKEFKTPLVIVSAFRSYGYQVGIKKAWCSDVFCARAWYSEHQTGLAVDLFAATDSKTFLSNLSYAKYFDWLNENAYLFWFTNSYKKGKAVDWYEIEPWHWRYVWKDLAKVLHDGAQSFTEYYLANR